MVELTRKERLLRVLRKETVDRPPVVCTGGMMNAAIVDVMKRSSITLPEAHFDEGAMADLAAAVCEYTGFDNIGVPFCMTVEPEVLGSRIDFGSLTCEPKIAAEAFDSASAVSFLPLTGLNGKGRAKTVAGAVRRLSRAYPDVPVVASLTGPISTAASIVEPMTFLKELRKNPDGVRALLEYVIDFLAGYAELLIENGADVIGIGDPTATGEILGPIMFGRYAVPSLNSLADRIHALNVPVILHICGRLDKVRYLIPRLHEDAFSTDAMVNLEGLKQEFPALTTMGNVSTYLLQFGTPEKVTRNTEKTRGAGDRHHRSGLRSQHLHFSRKHSCLDGHRQEGANMLVRFLATDTSVRVPAGATLLDAARLADVAVESPCNGSGRCGKCRVRVSRASLANLHLSPVNKDPADGHDGTVAACRAFIRGDVVVETAVAESSEIRILTAGREAVLELNPAIRKTYRQEEGLTVITHEGNVLAVEPGDTTGHSFGAAVDIGTTTVVVSLIDLNTGKEIQTTSFLNPQTLYGHDVLSRIRFASEAEGLDTLHFCIARELTQALETLTQKVASPPPESMRWC